MRIMTIDETRSALAGIAGSDAVILRRAMGTAVQLRAASALAGLESIVRHMCRTFFSTQYGAEDRDALAGVGWVLLTLGDAPSVDHWVATGHVPA